MQISNSELHLKIKSLAAQERRVSLEVLTHLQMIDDRRVYAQMGYSSLFTYCTRELGYSEGAAFRRISSMRLLRAVPEVAEQVERGELTLSHLSLVQQFTEVEKITSKEEKIQLVTLLHGQSTRDAKVELAKLSTQPAFLSQEKVVPGPGGMVRVELVIPQGLLAEIEELKALLSHALEKQDLQSTLRHAVRECLAKARKKCEISPRSTSAPKLNPVRPAFISNSVRRQVWQRDGKQCVFQNGAQKCGSTHFLQIDHIQPVAHGGKSTLDNLRLHCFRHNQWQAEAAGLIRPRAADH